MFSLNIGFILTSTLILLFSIYNIILIVVYKQVKSKVDKALNYSDYGIALIKVNNKKINLKTSIVEFQRYCTLLLALGKEKDIFKYFFKRSYIYKLNILKRDTFHFDFLLNKVIENILNLKDSEINSFEDDLIEDFIYSSRTKSEYDLDNKHIYLKVIKISKQFFFIILDFRNYYKESIRDSITLLERSTKIEKRDASSLYIGAALLNINNFRAINETYGANFGDKLLYITASRILNNLPPGVEVFKEGGDEFLLLFKLGYNFTKDNLKPFLKALISTLEHPIEISNQDTYLVSFRCGFSLEEHNTIKENINFASIALKIAGSKKENISYKITGYKIGMKDIYQRKEDINSIREGIINKQFKPWYQPIFKLNSDITDYHDLLSLSNISGVECLCRWYNPIKGLVMPSNFIDLIEAEDLLFYITKLMLETSASELHSILSSLNIDRKFIYSVNVGISDFNKLDSKFINSLLTNNKNTLKKLEPVLEVTETRFFNYNDELLFNQIESFIIDNKLSLAIDDFGAGWGAFTLLLKLPIRYIKIDKQFIDDLDICKLIVEICHSKGIKVIAEGIEKPNQIDNLTRLGVDYGQGYLLSKPLSNYQLRSFLEDLSLTTD